MQRKTPVYLNIYDLHSYNKYGYWLGLGAFHAGVEIDNKGKPITTLKTHEYNCFLIYLFI